jgi:hypothetical protein
MIRRLIFASVALAGTCLAVACFQAGTWPWTAASIGLSALWLTGEGWRWRLASPLGLAGCVGLAALSIQLGSQAGVAWLALLAVIAALCAWDLDGLARRLSRFAYMGDQARRERQHLGRLLAVAALSLLLGGTALALDLSLSFLPAFLLSLLVVLGLSWAAFLLRTEGS